MEINVNELMDKVLSQLEKEVKTETVIGKEFQMGDYTVVPVMKVGMGFGGGGGKSPKQGEGSGGGAGAGFGISPVGFLVTKGDEIGMIAANKAKGFGAMLEKLPDVLEKAIEMKFGQDKDSTEQKDEKESL